MTSPPGDTASYYNHYSFSKCKIEDYSVSYFQFHHHEGIACYYICLDWLGILLLCVILFSTLIFMAHIITTIPITYYIQAKL